MNRIWRYTSKPHC